MVRKNEIEKQNPLLGMSILDILGKMFPDPKYVSLFVNIMRKEINRPTQSEWGEVFYDRGVKINRLTSITAGGISLLELMVIREIFALDYIPQMDRFISLYERNLILKRDLSEYSSFDDLQTQISVASLRAITKDMEKEIKKIHEDDEWLVLMPLSYESSQKYGANTKWCTASAEYPTHFYRYVRSGCLIYCINKISGLKVAAFYDKGVDGLSFWNSKDSRIDSFISGMPSYIMDIMRPYFIDEYKTNVQHMSELQYENFATHESSILKNDTAEVDPPQRAGGLVGEPILRIVEEDHEDGPQMENREIVLNMVFEQLGING